MSGVGNKERPLRSGADDLSHSHPLALGGKHGKNATLTLENNKFISWNPNIAAHDYVWRIGVLYEIRASTACMVTNRAHDTAKWRMAITQSVGIDFGTSNSVCALLRDQRAELVPVEGDKFTLPSAIFFAEKDRTLFGREAIQAYVEGEEGRLMRGLKSVLGTAIMHEKTAVNGRYRSFEDILTIFIDNLKAKTEAYAGEKITRVVLGRPVHFHDENETADQEAEDTLRRIATRVGFSDISFQYEPVAAAFAHEQALDEDALAMVVDLGGGTSDFTIIKLSPENSVFKDRADDILATSGVRVGGTNLDKHLSLRCFMPHLGLGTQITSHFDKSKLLPVPPNAYVNLSQWHLVNAAQTNKAIRETTEILQAAIEPEKIERLLKLQTEKRGHNFLQYVESTKIALSEAAKSHADLRQMGFDFQVSVSRREFNLHIEEAIQKMARALDECLAKAHMNADKINLVILTGGSSELPVINHLIQKKFPKARISKEDKFGSVGRGLAYSAHQK